MYLTRKINSDLIWVGANDRRLALFEGVYAVQKGISYNAYLLLDDKTVLFDTVDKACSQRLLENLAHELNGRNLDFVVVHHMEPDHSATLSLVLQMYPEAKIIGNAKIKTMIKQFFDIEDERFVVVNEGDKMSFGKHELTFINAPMVHWPEVMMSYDITDKTLFTADAFGVFGAINGKLFADEVDFMRDYLDEARRYYTNIVGKYGQMVVKALEKIATLEVSTVCPLHGFVWRKDFDKYLSKYLLWASYKPEEKGVLVAYASIYGNTETAAERLCASLSEKGVRTELYDVSVTPASEIISAAFRFSHMVFASATYNAGVFVKIEDLLHDLSAHNIQNRKVSYIESGSWAPVAAKKMQEILQPCKNLEQLGETVTVLSAVKEGDIAKIEALANAIADDINA